jgi:hypothetical protein
MDAMTYSSTASGHVITDILARDIEEIREVEQRQPSKTVNPLPAWVAGMLPLKYLRRVNVL